MGLFHVSFIVAHIQAFASLGFVKIIQKQKTNNAFPRSFKLTSNSVAQEAGDYSPRCLVKENDLISFVFTWNSLYRIMVTGVEDIHTLFATLGYTLLRGYAATLLRCTTRYANAV